MATVVFPITNTTTSVLIPTVNAIQYKREALDVLEKTRHFNEVFTDDKAEKQNGRTVMWYRPQNFATASLAPDTDGDNPTQLGYANKQVPATLGNYCDWVAVSTFMQDTSPTPDLQDASERLGYRGALRMDTLTRSVLDAEFVGMTLTSLSGYLTVRDLRNARTQLKNSDVRPQRKFGNRFPVIASPLTTYDLVNDPTVGGYLDIMKYNTDVKASPLVQYNLDDGLADVAGCRIIETTNGKVVAGSPNNYYVYILGEGGFGKVSLNVKAPTFGDPMKARFNIYMGKGGPGPWDPTGQMGGFASYNVYYTAACLDGNAAWGGTYRGKIMSVQSSVG